MANNHYLDSMTKQIWEERLSSIVCPVCKCTFDVTVKSIEKQTIKLPCLHEEYTDKYKLELKNLNSDRLNRMDKI